MVPRRPRSLSEAPAGGAGRRLVAPRAVLGLLGGIGAVLGLGEPALAHGGGPGVPEWQQSLGDLAVLGLALVVALVLGGNALAPLLRGVPRRRLLALSLVPAVLLAWMLSLLARGTVGRVLFPEPPPPEYRSARAERGGAVATAQGYHVELSRSGDELRLWLSDSYRRPIEPAHFAGTLEVRGRALPLEERAGHRFARAPGAGGEVTATLEVPGGTLRIRWSLGPGGRVRALEPFEPGGPPPSREG